VRGEEETPGEEAHRVFCTSGLLGTSEDAPPGVARIAAVWVLRPAFAAVEAEAVVVPGEICSVAVARAGLAAPVVEAGATAARDGTAVEWALLQSAAEQGETGVGVGPVWFGAEVERAGFRAGWDVPEAGLDDCPVELDGSEAESGVPAAAWVGLGESQAALGGPVAGWVGLAESQAALGGPEAGWVELVESQAALGGPAAGWVEPVGFGAGPAEFQAEEFGQGG
jgi:hypothetical protein